MGSASGIQNVLGELHELLQRREVLIAIGALSVGTFVASVLGIPYFLARLPADYYSRREQRRLGIEPARRPLRLAAVVLRNVFGATLLVLGAAMLVLPGQGLLTLLVALMLLDFPGKHRLERRILRTPGVLRVVNALRARAERPPLDLGSVDAVDASDGRGPETSSRP